MAKTNYSPAPDELATIDRLAEKAEQAFQLAIELYNRPTLPNKVEACSMMLANAWELLFKSHLIQTKGLDSIFFKDKPERSLALTDCIAKVLPNELDPIRKNIEEITRLRNDSTHFIVDEYEIVYGPILQANVEHFANKLSELRGKSVTDSLPGRSLILPVSGDALDEEVIKEKYDASTAQKLFENYHRLQELWESDTSGKFAFFYRVDLNLVKRSEHADLTIAYDAEAEQNGLIVKQLQDPNETHPFRRQDCLKQIGKRINKAGIQLQYNGQVKERFTSADWDNFVKAYGMKQNPEFSYDRATPKQKQSSYSYSSKAVDFVFELIKENPACCLDRARNKVKEMAQEKN